MGYTASGGPKGLGVFTNTPQTVADLNKVVELIARAGNMRVETTGSRDAITGSALYEGLLIFNTTTDQIERYTGSGWAVVWRDDPVPTSVLVGSIPPAGTRLIRQAGTSLVDANTNANGDCSIIYPEPFPNGVISAQADRVNFDIGPSVHTLHQVQSLTSLNIRVYGVNNGLAAPGIRPRFSWTAVGW